jgi:hypothetical protein
MTPRRLILNWRHEPSNASIPVAELLAGPSDVPRYEFGYVQGVRRARLLGFQPFLAFPELHRRYAGTQLFPFFRNRVLSRTRPDYASYVETLGLSVKTADVVDLLGRSEGRRRTDGVEMALVPERDLRTGEYVTRFLLRGVRHLAAAEAVISRLGSGNELESVSVPKGSHKHRTRSLYFKGEAIGRVADYLLADLDALEAADAAPQFIVERVNPPPHPAHHRVLVRIEAPWPTGFKPFSGPEFRPYQSGVSPLPMVS